MPRNISIRLRKGKKPKSKPKPRLDPVRVHTKTELAKTVITGTARRKRNIRLHTKETDRIDALIKRLKSRKPTPVTRNRLKKLNKMKKGAESAIIHNQFEIERYALGKMGSNIKPPTRKKLASLRAEEDAAFERSKEMDRQEEYEKPRKFTRKKLTTRRLITMRKNKKTR